MKLLLIDDDVYLRDMYSLKFTQAGHEVRATDGPLTAIAELNRDSEVDCILLDMIMPDITGPELIRRIKLQFPDLQAKCIVLSNQGLEEDIAAATTAGAVGYIIKSDTVPSQVVKKVEEVLAKKK